MIAPADMIILDEVLLILPTRLVFCAFHIDICIRYSADCPQVHVRELVRGIMPLTS